MENECSLGRLLEGAVFVDRALLQEPMSADWLRSDMLRRDNMCSSRLYLRPPQKSRSQDVSAKSASAPLIPGFPDTVPS